WSHNLLDEPQRALFARLGVFAGGVDLRAVEAANGWFAPEEARAAAAPSIGAALADGTAPGGGTVGSSDESGPGAPAGVDGETRDALGVLVESSLVRPEPGDGEPRFRMLDSIRDYALERLRDNGEWREAHRGHAAHFLALALEAEPHLNRSAEPA